MTGILNLNFLQSITTPAKLFEAKILANNLDFYILFVTQKITYFLEITFIFLKDTTRNLKTFAFVSNLSIMFLPLGNL